MDKGLNESQWHEYSQAVGNGTASLRYPAGMTEGDYDDLICWLRLIVRQAERRAGEAGAQPPAERSEKGETEEPQEETG